MAQRSPIDEEEAIPFGIRAIESGIEVEGIWISRPNTPMPIQPVSPASSFGNGCPGPVMVPSIYGTRQIGESRPRPDFPSRSRACSDTSVSVPKRSFSADRSTARYSVDGLPRDRRPPPSFSRYKNRNVYRNSVALSALEGLDRKRPELRMGTSSPLQTPIASMFCSYSLSLSVHRTTDNGDICSF